MRQRIEWQKAYLNGVVLIWPPEEIRSRINPLRAKYDPVSHSYCEAHISLTPPFVKAPNEHDWQAVQKVAAGFAPFDIIFGPVAGWFQQSIIYLEVHPSEYLNALRDALLTTRLFAESHFNQFVPHMTITEGLSGLSMSEKLLADLQKTVQGGSFFCNHLAYARPNRDFQFKAERLILLGARRMQ